MIVEATSNGGRRIVGTLEPGTRLYVDREWLVPTATLPALVVQADGLLHWSDSHHPIEYAGAPEAAVAGLFRALATRIAAAVDGTSPTAVEVMGAGIVAAETSRLLGVRHERGAKEPPGAVVDTTGDPEAIDQASRRLADGGTLVLAGEPAGRRTELNLYRDVHVRGLEVVGVPRPRSLEDVGEDPPLVRPARARTREVLTPAAWYCIVSA